MQKKILSIILSVAMIFGTFTCLTTMSDVSVSAATTSQKNIAKRGDRMYALKWTALKTISGWRGQYTFSSGGSYRIPYGQPVYAGKYIGHNVSFQDFMISTLDSSSVFYTSQSEYAGKTSTYYANDCSAYVSSAWGLSRQTTATLGSFSTSYGGCTSSNVDKIQLGDALNLSGSHVVLVTDVTYDGSTVSSIEITEQTPPQLKRTTHTRSSLISKYSSYTILRCKSSVSAPTFKFTFNANGGTGTMSDQTVSYGTTTNINANKFTKEGYDFIGWNAYRKISQKWRYTNGTTTGWYKSGSQPAGYYLFVYDNKHSISTTGLGVEDTVQLKAVWGRNNYTVKYNANGGSGTMSSSSHIRGVSKALSANKYTLSGSTFAGWYLSRKSDGKSLYTFDNMDTNKWYVPGEQPDGYRLSLYHDQRLVSALSSVEGDVVTCTAQWVPNTTGTDTFYIDYNANGGTGSMERTKVVIGTSTKTTKNAFVKPGYKFKGWYVFRRKNDQWIVKDSSGNSSWKKYENITSDYTYKVYSNGCSVASTSTVDTDIVTFYAQWEEDFKFTLKYQPNGGIGTMADQTIAYGVSTPISTNQFTKTGYTFTGWNAYRVSTKEWFYTDGTNEGWYTEGSQPSGYELYLYTDGKAVSKTGTGYDDVVNMYAVWTPNSYTVTYDSNGGTGEMPDSKATYDVATNLQTSTFTKQYAEFTGWNAYRKSDSKWYCVNVSDSTDTQWLSESEMTDSYKLYTFADNEEFTNLSAVNDDTITMSAVWVDTLIVGDVNVDRIINVTDATELQKLLVNNTVLEGDMLVICDTNSDGYINIKDSTLIQKFVAGFVSNF